MYKVAKQVDKQLNNNEQTLIRDCEDPPQTQPMHDPPSTQLPHVSGEESTNDSDSDTEEIMDHTFNNLIMKL